MYRISGSIPAGNFIQLPKSSSQSLGLTGRYLYLIFRPLPSKCFVVHIEVVTLSGLVVRVSFSNLFKEFKSTSTWLQFPFLTGSDKENSGTKPDSSVNCWTLLTLDLKAILTKYVHAKYANVKNIKLCSNLLVKSVFTSDIEFSPFVEPGRGKEGPMQALPRDMAFPVAKGKAFLDTYEYVRFPTAEVGEIKGVPPSLKGQPSGTVHTDVGTGGGREVGRKTLSETERRSSEKLGKAQLPAFSTHVRTCMSDCRMIVSSVFSLSPCSLCCFLCNTSCSIWRPGTLLPPFFQAFPASSFDPLQLPNVLLLAIETRGRKGLRMRLAHNVLCTWCHTCLAVRKEGT